MLEKTEGKRRSGQQRLRLLNSITSSMDLSKFWETVVVRGAWHATVHEVEESQTRLNYWTATVGDGQGGVACCGPWGHKESDTMSD